MLPQIKTILYASDLGESSRPAFRVAASMAEKYQAKIVFVHVIPEVDHYVNGIVAQSISPDELAKLRAKGLKNIQQNMDERLQDFCDKELEGADFPGGKPETHLLKGDAGKEILALADKIDADLIAMGTRRHSRVGELLMGSVAYKISHRSTRPMLMVPIGD